MDKNDIIKCATYMAEQEKYSITIYIDVKGNITFMNTGVAENCWPNDIKKIYGILKYDNGETSFLDFSEHDNWSEEDKKFYEKSLDIMTAREEYEKRSKIGSRFTWPEIDIK